jgi:hypothetical protein
MAPIGFIPPNAGGEAVFSGLSEGELLIIGGADGTGLKIVG